MAKSKPEQTTLIQDPQKRRVTLSKRKKALLLSAIELSNLCGQKIFLSIFDEDKQRMVHFSSQADFTISAVHAQAKSLASAGGPDRRIESFTNKDYNLIKQKDFRKRQARKAIRKNPSPKLSDLESEGSELDQYSPPIHNPILHKRLKKSPNAASLLSSESRATSSELLQKEPVALPKVVGEGGGFWFDLLTRKLPNPIEQGADIKGRAPEQKSDLSILDPAPPAKAVIRTTTICGSADPTVLLRRPFPLAKPKKLVESSRIVIPQ